MKLSLYHKIRIIFGIIILVNTNALSQDSLMVSNQINIQNNISFINSDASGYIYLIKKDEIIKINSKGKELLDIVINLLEKSLDLISLTH